MLAYIQSCLPYAAGVLLCLAAAQPMLANIPAKTEVLPVVITVPGPERLVTKTVEVASPAQAAEVSRLKSLLESANARLAALEAITGPEPVSITRPQAAASCASGACAVTSARGDAPVRRRLFRRRG